MRKLKNSELDRLTVDEFKKADKFPIVIVLDNIRSQNNIGSAFRTGDAFRIESLYLCGITATPPHREIHKTALGAENTVEWKYFDHTADAINQLREKGYKIVTVEQAAQSTKLNDFKPPVSEKLALVFGNEVEGVDDSIMEMADYCVEIPQFGTKHSLNITVSLGIVVWHIASQTFMPLISR
ncbi:MAG: RNA methyltransferase [Bacteroidota bacterium]|nr:RNA methyltransferase [Bacteroidota bacterium]